MKRLTILATALIPAITMFAYYGDYGYSSRHDEMSGFAIFLWIVAFICSVILLIRWWKMTADIKAIKQKLTTPGDEKISYLLALGEMEHAEKLVLTRLIDVMYPIYAEGIRNNRKKEFTAREIDNSIQPFIRGYSHLKVNIPEYARSGQAFIEYMDEVTGKK